jgi:hypothetical protein
MRAPSKTALFNAVKLWDAPAIEALLAVSPSLAQATDSKGRTALHLACSVKPSNRAIGEPDGLRTVAVLLKAGAPLEAEAPMDEDEGDFRATPLWYAVARGENLPLVQFLLRLGADPSYSLWAVVWRDDDVVCRELLKNRPRLDLKGPWRNANLLCGSPQTAEDTRPADRGGRESGDRGRQRPRRCGHRTCAPIAEEPDRPISRLQAPQSTSDTLDTDSVAAFGGGLRLFAHLGRLSDVSNRREEIAVDRGG